MRRWSVAVALSLCVLLAACAVIFLSKSQAFTRLRYDLSHHGDTMRWPVAVLSSNPAQVSVGEVLFLQRSMGNLGSTFYGDSDRTMLATRDLGHAVVLGDSTARLWLERSDLMRNGQFITRGVGGQTAMDVLLRTETEAVQLAPRLVVLQVGVNDLLKTRGAYPLSFTESNITAILDILKANGIPTVMTTLPPVHVNPSVAPDVVVLNAWIQRTAAERSLPLADFYSVLSDDGNYRVGLSDDGIHPTAAGYSLMKPLLLDAIAKLPASAKP